MTSTQGEDFPPSGPSVGPVESDADLSLYGGHHHGAGSSPSERPELNAAELSEQDPTQSGNGYTAAVSTRDSEMLSFASKLTSLIQGIVEQTRTTMDGLLTNVNEIDGSLAEVMAEFHNANEHGMDRKCKLEEDRHKVHQAACRVLEVLDITSSMIDHAPLTQLGPEDSER